jgi:hypothetical protein
MKCILLILTVFLGLTCNAQKYFQYDYPGKVWTGEQEIKTMREKDNKWSLDYLSLYEMIDSAIKYKELYFCSKRCNGWWKDSTIYYSNRTIYFINQSEWYCAIIYGADSVKSMLYYKKGETIPIELCRCDVMTAENTELPLPYVWRPKPQ